MKKLLCILLVLVFICIPVICGCDNKSTHSNDNNAPSGLIPNETKSSSTHSTKSSQQNNASQTWTKEQVQSIIQVHDIYVDDINSAEGVDMRISWTNTSDKTIKYVYFDVEPYNAVGDKLYCQIRKYSSFTAKVTGPCEGGYKGYFTVGDESIGDVYYYGNLWENCWYNGTVDSIKLLGIKIVYMDESIIELNESAANMAFAQYPNYSNKKALYHREMVAYNSDDNCQVFALSMFDMSWRSYADDIHIEIEIVNSASKKVFSKSYTKTQEQFFISDYLTGTDALTCGINITDYQISKGSTSIGTLRFKVFNDDLSIDFSGNLSIDNLPTY